MEKTLPKLFENEETCCGCSACYCVCPTKAISMLADKEGFEYPIVDEEKCIRCYACVSVCIFKKDQADKGFFDRGENE